MVYGKSPILARSTTLSSRPQSAMKNRSIAATLGINRRDKQRALRPFTIGGATMLLVPNKVDGAEANVLLIARDPTSAISRQLSLAEVRRLALYLTEAADEAEALARAGPSGSSKLLRDVDARADKRPRRALLGFRTGGFSRGDRSNE